MRIQDIVNENDLIYVSRVLLMLREMKMDEIRPLDKTNPNYDRFVNTVKSIIDLRMTQPFGFEIEFNPDYTKFKKLTRTTTAIENEMKNRG